MNNGGNMRDRIILFICAIVFMSCTTYLGSYYLQTRQSQKSYKDLAELIGETEPESLTSVLMLTEAAAITPTKAPVMKDTDDTAEVSPEILPITPTPGASELLTATPTPTPYAEPEILSKYQVLYDLNPDLIGWISIGGTVIDYPVVLKDNEYYLRRDFYGKDATAGCLFIDEKCTVVPERSTNIMINGHNMRAGTMFADLHKYKEEDFWKTHRYIRFDTIYEEATYEIVSVFLSQVYRSTDKVFKFYQFVNAENNMEFSSFIQNINQLELYDTGIKPEYGDELLTLITCSSHVEDKLGRLVVVARKITEE